MRGKATINQLRQAFQGITPAHAGKSTLGSVPECWCRDHPRACGEKAPEGGSLTALLGSPPRMRGKAIVGEKFGLFARITPAHAGKSKAWERVQMEK